MGNDIITCFNGSECTYANCKQFNKQLDTCNFIIVGLLDGAPAPTDKTPVKDQPQRVPETADLVIRELKAGDKKLTLMGKLDGDPVQRDVNTGSGPATVTSIILDDGTGKAKISWWDEAGDAIMKYKSQDGVKIENMWRVKEFYENTPQIDAGKYAKITPT